MILEILAFWPAHSYCNLKIHKHIFEELFSPSPTPNSSPNIAGLRMRVWVKLLSIAMHSRSASLWFHQYGAQLVACKQIAHACLSNNFIIFLDLLEGKGTQTFRRTMTFHHMLRCDDGEIKPRNVKPKGLAIFMIQFHWIAQLQFAKGLAQIRDCLWSFTPEHAHSTNVVPVLAYCAVCAWYMIKRKYTVTNSNKCWKLLNTITTESKSLYGNYLGQAMPPKKGKT